MLLLLSAAAAAPTPTPTPTTEAGSPMWGPWKPIVVRPLIRGSISAAAPMPTVTITGTVIDDEDWLLGIPSEDLF